MGGGGGGEGGRRGCGSVEASGGEGVMDAARLNAFLAAALSRVVCTAVPTPVDAAVSTSVLPSAAVGGFGSGVLGHF